MTTRHQLLCAGPHTGGDETCGFVELPDDTPPDRVAAVVAGVVLCDDCGDVYQFAVAMRDHPPGDPPSTDLVCDVLAALRPAGYMPRHPPGPPSWAPTGRPWPYPARPKNVPPPRA